MKMSKVKVKKNKVLLLKLHIPNELTFLLCTDTDADTGPYNTVSAVEARIAVELSERVIG